MKLNSFYQRAYTAGIEADLRGKAAITQILKKAKGDYEALPSDKKPFFDKEAFTNPFSDTRILNGSGTADIKSVIAGIDVEGPELLLVDRMKAKGVNIDLVMAHHPEGCAFAGFYRVMDLQIDAFATKGVSLVAAENLLAVRRAQVARRVHAANHQRSVDIAKMLGLNYVCVHTPADNLAYKHVNKVVDKAKPKNLGEVIDALYTIEEYKHAARQNNPPKIVIGSKTSRVSNILFEFTGGTEGPKEIYEKLSNQGVDTIVAMHQSEEHYKSCKDANINVIFASHIASDNLGVNLILDKVIGSEKIKVHEFSGFRRVARKK